MPLEVGTYISDLVASNPTGSDNKSTGDDHLRLIKSAIKATFPSLTGPVTKTQSQMIAAHDQRVPVGGIIMWSGAVADIPAGWLLCNGASGTPDLRGRFLVGAGGDYSVGGMGGSADAVLVSHTHTVGPKVGAAGTGGTEGYVYNEGSGAPIGTGTTLTAGVSATGANLPPYYALAYIMKAA